MTYIISQKNLKLMLLSRYGDRKMTTIGVTECSRLIHLLSSKFKKMLRRTLRKPSSTEPKTAILSTSLKINKLIKSHILLATTLIFRKL